MTMEERLDAMMKQMELQAAQTAALAEQLKASEAARIAAEKAAQDRCIFTETDLPRWVVRMVEMAVVADAIAEHYLPRFAGDALPQSREACCVALADKLDTLVGIFGIGQIPTGDKDPFALRRHALGVIRILAERGLPLDIATVLKLAHESFPSDSAIAKADALGIKGTPAFIVGNELIPGAISVEEMQKRIAAVRNTPG